MEKRREEEEEGRATHLVRRRCGAEDEALREAAPVQDGIRRQTSLDQKSKKRDDKEGRPHRHGHPKLLRSREGMKGRRAYVERMMREKFGVEWKGRREIQRGEKRIITGGGTWRGVSRERERKRGRTVRQSALAGKSVV